MIYELTQRFSKDIKLRLIFYAIFTIILSLIQVIIIPIIKIEGFTPDILLIFVCWVSLIEGRFIGTVNGFYVGMVLDAMSMGMLGVNALSKTLAAFTAGMWYNEDKIYQNTRNIKFVLIVALCSVLNNLIYNFIYMDISTFTWDSYFFQSVPASAAYTSILATLPMLLAARRRREF